MRFLCDLFFPNAWISIEAQHIHNDLLVESPIFQHEFLQSHICLYSNEYKIEVNSSSSCISWEFRCIEFCGKFCKHVTNFPPICHENQCENDCDESSDVSEQRIRFLRTFRVDLRLDRFMHSPEVFESYHLS